MLLTPNKTVSGSPAAGMNKDSPANRYQYPTEQKNRTVLLTFVAGNLKSFSAAKRKEKRPTEADRPSI
jgi:hypothetical protein